MSGGGYETIQLHRFQAATECYAETTEAVCIPPHSEVMLWTKLKTNNGRRGPTAGVVLGLQTFVQEVGLLVGRSLVRADADDWKIRYCYIIRTPVQCCLTLVRATRSYYQHIHGSRESRRSRRSSTSGLERLKCSQRSARFHPIWWMFWMQQQS